MLMPASRAELVFPNDNGDAAERRLVFQTEDGSDTEETRSPEIKLAEVVLEETPIVVASVGRARNCEQDLSESRPGRRSSRGRWKHTATRRLHTRH